MPDDAIGRTFVDESRRLLTAAYLPRIARAVESLTAEDVWWRPNDASNSIGNLLLHLNGNVSQWILAGVGGQPFDRRRQQEFDERGPVPIEILMARLSDTVRAADGILASIDDEGLLGRRHIQGHDLNVLEAVYHVVEHFSTHTGQIVWIAKARTGVDLKLWVPPPAT